MRIEQHPVLGTYDKGPLVEFTMDGKTMTGYEGEPIAAALRAAGILQHRRTRKTGEARGVSIRPRSADSASAKCCCRRRKRRA